MNHVGGLIDCRIKALRAIAQSLVVYGKDLRLRLVQVVLYLVLVVVSIGG